MTLNPRPISHPIPRHVSTLAVACLATASAWGISFAANATTHGSADFTLAPTARHVGDCCYMTDMATSDLNKDGDNDIVTGNGMSYDIGLLMSDGSGGFSDLNTLPLPSASYGYVVVALGDVVGDAHLDVVATGYSSSGIAVYPGAAGGTFDTALTLDSGGQTPKAVALANVNGDSHADILVAHGDSGDVSVLLGDGDGFAPPLTYTAGAWPASMAVGDVDDDGDIDIVTGNAGSLDVSLLRGDGSGGFSAPINYSIGASAEPMAVVVADATGDGVVDIVTANRSSDGSPFPPPELPGTISLLAGDGSGGFAPAVQFGIGAGIGRADDVEVGDISADDRPDIAVSLPLDNRVVVLRGNDGGGFAAPELYPTGVGPSPIVMADVTADGHLDIAVADAVGATLSILPGDGQGDIGFDGNFPAGDFPHAIAHADFDQDGDPDLAVANAMSGDVSILLNTDGNIVTNMRHAVGASPTSIVTGDVNNDSAADVVTANLGSGNVSVLLGDGNGGFAGAQNVSVGSGQSPYAVDLGDANGDGWLDIVTANTSLQSEGISLLLNDGAGGFGPAVEMPVGSGTFHQPQGIVMADVTGDGAADIVTANVGSNDLSFLVGNGSGDFAAAVSLPIDGQSPVAVVAADLDVDGSVDLVSLNQASQNVSVLLGDGAGGFATAVGYPIYPPETVVNFNPWPWGIAIADISSDGELDVVTANTQNGTVSVLPGNGSGGFDGYFNFDTGARPGSVTVADMDADGAADVVTANRENDNVSVLFHLGTGDLIFADGFDGPG